MTSLPVAMDYDYYEQVFICPICKSFSSEPTCRNNHVITIDDDGDGGYNDKDYDDNSQSSISSLLAQFVSVGYKIVPDPSALKTDSLRSWRPTKPSFFCHECGVESTEATCSNNHDDAKILKDVCERCYEEFDSVSEFLKHKVSAHPVEAVEEVIKKEPEEVVPEKEKVVPEKVVPEITSPTLVQMPTAKVPKLSEKFTHLVLKGTLGIGQYQVMTSTAGFVYPEVEETEEDILEWDDSIELAVLTSGGESSVSLAKNEPVVVVQEIEPSKEQPRLEVVKQQRQFLRCLKCEIEFPHVEGLIYHPCSEREQFPGFQCQFCQRWYVKEQWFARHMKLHINLLPQTCPKCDEGYLTQEELESHQCSGQKPKKLEKQPTDAAKRNENKILPHYYICQICNISLRSERQLNLHLHIHELAKANAIKLAMEQQKMQQQQQQRQAEEGEKEILPTDPESTIPESTDTTTTATAKPPSKQIHIFECNICSTTMRSIEDVRIHLASHASNRLYKCESCNGRFATTRDLQQHKCPKALASPPPSKAPTKRKATDPPKQGVRPKLVIPKKVAEELVLEEHKCVHCGKVFGQAAGLACHMKEHSEDPEGRFQCEKCPLKFKILRSLIVHRAKFH